MILLFLMYGLNLNTLTVNQRDLKRLNQIKA